MISVHNQGSRTIKLPYKGYNSGRIATSYDVYGCPTYAYAVRVFDPALNGCTLRINGTEPMNIPHPAGTEIEDGRLFWHKNKPHIAFTEGHYTKKPFLSIQRLAELNDDLTFKRDIPLSFGTNGKLSEKNWQFFSYKNKLHFVYSIAPSHTVVRISDSGKIEEVFNTGTKAVWPFGHMAGGTPPVKHNGEWVSFFHSYVVCPRFKRRYAAAAYKFNDSFEVTGISDPLWIGSEQDSRNNPHPKGYDWDPLVVFPTAAEFEGDCWSVVAGVNDVYDVTFLIDTPTFKCPEEFDGITYWKTKIPNHPTVKWDRVGRLYGKKAISGQRNIALAFCAPTAELITKQEYEGMK